MEEAFIGRQAILDQQKNVYAYEILFRSGLKNAFDPNLDGNVATQSVMVNAMLDFGMNKLVSDKRAFINFTEQNLLTRAPKLLPSETVVVEILENVQPTPEILEAVKELKEAGYKIALDDFVLLPGYEPLIEMADIIKVDFRITESPEERKKMREILPKHVRLLAEKIETEEEFQQALAYGYVLFQGYFFCKPTILQQKRLTSNALSKMRLLREINRQNVDFSAITGVISSDTNLVHKLLTYINSAGVGLANHVSNLKQATVLLGASGVRRWVTLVSLQTFSEDKPPELFTLSLMRAKFCELIAAKLKRSGLTADTGFLLGMFSLLDVLLNLPMEEVLKEVNLSDELTDALLGKDNDLRRLLDLVIAYEKGDWDTVIAYCERENLSPEFLQPTYDNVLEWYNALQSIS
ncbi:EAL and HDOD domain-containing protein [Selenomonas dianae]|uniref:HDOD domain-containing protein n=1 Tax=Selenomonas dianae TaxID=135079 RepID=A0ABP3CGT6_9FIRM|nr:HDOD domain-containing protein [Selenomonas dianae]WLD82940.1 HDOD domain-containing protein [Selenomonas dianae]